MFCSPHVRESKTVLDSGFHITDSGFRIPGPGFQSLSVELGFRIPIASGIQDSLRCVPDSKAQDSGFHKHTFPGLRNPDSLTWSDFVFLFQTT